MVTCGQAPAEVVTFRKRRCFSAFFVGKKIHPQIASSFCICFFRFRFQVCFYLCFLKYISFAGKEDRCIDNINSFKLRFVVLLKWWNGWFGFDWGNNSSRCHLRPCGAFSMIRFTFSKLDSFLSKFYSSFMIPIPFPARALEIKKPFANGYLFFVLHPLKAKPPKKHMLTCWAFIHFGSGVNHPEQRSWLFDLFGLCSLGCPPSRSCHLVRDPELNRLICQIFGKGTTPAMILCFVLFGNPPFGSIWKDVLVCFYLFQAFSRQIWEVLKVLLVII